MWSSVLRRGSVLAMATVLAAVAMTPPAASNPEEHVAAAYRVFVAGETPPSGATKFLACTGVAPVEGSCSGGAPGGHTRFWVSSCDAALASCSPFTGTLRLTLSDGGATSDDVYVMYFDAGVYWGWDLVAGTGTYDGPVTANVEVAPTQWLGRQVGAPVGEWRFWLTDA